MVDIGRVAGIGLEEVQGFIVHRDTPLQGIANARFSFKMIGLCPFFHLALPRRAAPSKEYWKPGPLPRGDPSRRQLVGNRSKPSRRVALLQFQQQTAMIVSAAAR